MIFYKDKLKYQIQEYTKGILNHLEYPIQNIKVYNNQNILNIGSGFDIETSRIDEHNSIVVCWQLSLDQNTLYGRSIESFIDCMNDIKEFFQLSDERKLLIYIHNASFEWQFLKKYINIAFDQKRKKPKIFATSERDIIYFETIQHIEFRDSLIYSGCKLDQLSSIYKLPIKKLVGEWDYSLIRSSSTPLSKDELSYIINDVQILQSFFHKHIQKEYLNKKIAIPLTKTGIPRNEMKRHFKKQPENIRQDHKNMIIKAFPNKQEYLSMFRWLFRGGYVHSNIVTTGDVMMFDNWSQDFKSSYPSIMLQETFPYRFCMKQALYFESIKSIIPKWSKSHAFYGTFKFKNIRAVSTITVESISKIVSYDSDSLISDNGRLMKCNEIVVCLTELDYMIYDKFYKWDEVECISKLRVADKKPLPTWFKDMILKYFMLKETLPKDSVEYAIAKTILNSLYGMCVTSICFNEYTLKHGNIVKCGATNFEKEMKKSLLLPQWGVWVTAYGRYRLLNYGFYPFIKSNSELDLLYGDTDSVKYKNDYANSYIFESYNNMIIRKNKTMYVGEYDRSLFMKIGTFDNEGKSMKFKSMRCKSYIHTDIKKSDQKYHLVDVTTIAGLPKGNLQAYAKNHNMDIYDCFNDKLQIIDECTKLSHFYNDNEFDDYVVDYLGNVSHETSRSSVTLNPSTFEMKMTKEYLKMIAYIKLSYQRRKGR